MATVTPPKKINFQGIQVLIAAPVATSGTAKYEPLMCLTSLSIDNGNRAEIDTTCAADTTKTFMFGLRDSAAITADGFYTPTEAGYVLAEASFASNDAYLFRIIFPDAVTPSTGKGTTKEFSGYVTSFSSNGAVDAVITASIGIKASGDVTTTPAS